MTNENSLIQNFKTLNNLPKNWEVLDFDKVITDVSGGNKKTKNSDLLNEGLIKVIDQGKELIAGFTNEKEALLKTETPHIVFGDHTRVFKYIEFPFAMGADGTKVLKVRKEIKSFEKYIYYFFQTLNIPETGYNRHFKYLKACKIPLPPLATQKRIAAILDEADTLRQLNQKLIDKYNALTQSLFLEMFGDPVTNPKGWEKKETQKLILQIEKLSNKNKIDFIDYVDISSINNVTHQIESTTKYKFEDRPSRAQQIIKNGDVLLSTVRPNLKNIALNFSNNLIASTGFFIFRTNEKLNNRFLFELLKSDSITNSFIKITSGANYPALKNSELKKIKFIVPPIDLQNQFAERVKLIEEQKAQAQEALQKSETLFNSLLQRAFKGEL